MPDPTSVFDFPQCVAHRDLSPYCASPVAGEYTPIITRMDPYALVYYDPPYIICRSHNAPGGHYSSWLTQRVFGPYGIFKFRGKVAAPVANNAQVVGGLELHHGWATEGVIMFLTAGTDYIVQCSKNGSSINSVLAGEDWTVEREFKFDWQPTYLDFLIDDVLKWHVTNTIYIPDKAMPLFSEVGLDVPAAADATTFFRLKSFNNG